MGSSKAQKSKYKPVSAEKRLAAATAISKKGIKPNSADQYERKWKQFVQFCTDVELQGADGIVDPEGEGQPNEMIVGKIVLYFSYVVQEKGCDPGEVDKIKSALASRYKRQFHRVGEWKEFNGTTEGSPTNAIIATESASFYKREKKKKGTNRALPFRYRYMEKMCDFFNSHEPNGIRSVYLMGLSSLCFTLWLRIDEATKLTWGDVKMDEINKDGILHHIIHLKDRKYNRTDDGKDYALYYEEE